MLYDREHTIDYIIRIYSYLSGAVKRQPYSIKPDKVLHNKILDGFIAMAPECAGVDFIWRFLSFQFYWLATQTHIERQACGWFLGEVAFERYNQHCSREFYSFVRKWLNGLGITNPFRRVVVKGLSDEVLLAERYKMSRLGGLNYCCAKYGDNPYDPKNKVCVDCPSVKDCDVLFGGEDALYSKIVKDGKEVG